MAGSLGKAAAGMASPALDASIELQGSAGMFLFRITTSNVEVTKEISGVAVVGTVFVGLGALWASSYLARTIVNARLNNAFGVENDDQNIEESRIGSLLVTIRCFTDERFLEVLADYESGETKRRLEKEFEQVGLKVEWLIVEIENTDEVKKKSTAINERLDDQRVEIIQDMEDITEEEKNAAFQLGETIVSIKMLSRANKTPKPRREIRLLYNKYIGIASKLGFHLQDPPPEETTTDAEMEIFITKQSNQVDECFARRGNMCIITLYNAGYQFSFLSVFLTFKCKDNPEERIQVNESIRTCAGKLKSYANELGIDLSEELERAMNVKQMKEITEIGKQMKEKLQTVRDTNGGRCKREANDRRCKREANDRRCKGSENKRSEIDQTRFITDEVWTVSLVRLPDSSHCEHAFLAVEGKSGNKYMIWFADFVAKDTSDLYHPGMRDGKVRMDFHESDEAPDSSSKLLFRCRKKLMKIENGNRLLFSTWQICKVTAETLIKNIQAQKASPPKYNIVGHTKLAASSATSSSNDTGHNCFTFARAMLRDLNDECIMIPEDTLDKWILSATSRYLIEKQFNKKSWKTSTFALVLALVFLAGVIAAYYIPKLL